MILNCGTFPLPFTAPWPRPGHERRVRSRDAGALADPKWRQCSAADAGGAQEGQRRESRTTHENGRDPSGKENINKEIAGKNLLEKTN